MILEDGSKSFYRVASSWKLLLIFLAAGLVGLYFLLSQLDARPSYYSLRLDPLLEFWSKEEFCPQRFAKPTTEYQQHYPKPTSYSRKNCACTPVHYFVLLSTQRSGSGWFETLLNSHPSISSHGEIFSVKPRRHNFTTISQTLDAVYNLDWYNSAAKNSCTSAVGFKWMLNQGALEFNRDTSSYFKRRGVSVIFLLRRNGLKRLISILANAYDRRQPLNGAHLSHVHSEEEAAKLASYKPTIDISNLLSDLERYHTMVEDALDALKSIRLLVVYYEDLVKEPERTQLLVQEFLGVVPRKLKSKQVKIHKGPLSESVTNWEAVLHELNGTTFQAFLADDDYS